MEALTELNSDIPPNKEKSKPKKKEKKDTKSVNLKKKKVDGAILEIEEAEQLA